MEEDDRKKLQGNYEELVRDLRVQDVSDYLFEKGVLTEEDLETINFKDRGITPQEAVRRLLRILRKRGGKSFAVFIESLRNDNSDLAEKVSSTDTTLIVLCDDEVDSSKETLNILKQQLELQTRTTIRFMDEIDELKKKEKDHDNLKAKYEELDRTLKEIGITEKEAKDCLKEFFLSGRKLKFEGHTTEGYIHNNQDPDQLDVAKVGKYVAQGGDQVPNWPEFDTPADFTEVVARTLGVDIAYYVAHDYSEDKPAPNVYCQTLRRLAKELLALHREEFARFLDQLFVTTGNGYQTLVHIADTMFDNGTTWGRIVVLYAFGAWMAKFYHQTGSSELADIVGNFIGFYISHNHKDWIQANGGWDAFNKFFSKRDTTEDTDGESRSARDELLNKVLITSVLSAGLIALISVVTKR